MELAPLGLHAVSVLSRAAEAIRVTAVAAFIDSPFGAPRQSFVSVGAPPADCCDALVVINRGLTPITTAQTGPCDPFRWSSNWTLRILRPCAQPGLGSIYRQLPAVTTSEPFEQMMMVDAAVLGFLFAPMVQPAVSEVVVPSFMAGMHCVTYTPGALTPTRQADCAGWDYPFGLGIDYRQAAP